MNIGDYEVEISSGRKGGGWEAVAIMPNGKKLISGPASSRESAEHDVKQQARSILYPQRRYDVNRPFESVDDDDLDWKEVTQEPVYKGYEAAALNRSGLTFQQLRNLWWNSSAHVYNWNDFCEHISTGALSATELIEAGVPVDYQVDFSKRQESMNKTRKYSELSAADEAVVMHQANKLLEAVSSNWVPPHQNLDPDTEMDIASKSGFSAWEFANRTGKQHPRLQQAVHGTPFEKLYSGKFSGGSRPTARPGLPRPKASFYPGDGGGAGGGGGITSA